MPERKGDGASRFNPRSDSNTDILAEKLADALEQKLGKRPYVVIARFHRGTQNGKTVSHLLSRSGREAVYGEMSLFGQLVKQGFAVFPPVGSSPREPKLHRPPHRRDTRQQLRRNHRRHSTGTRNEISRLQDR